MKPHDPFSGYRTPPVTLVHPTQEPVYPCKRAVEISAFVPFTSPEPLPEPDPPEMATYGGLELPADDWKTVWRLAMEHGLIEPEGSTQ